MKTIYNEYIGMTKLLEVLNTNDLRERIIKSHLTIELILNAMLSEAVVADHRKEIMKLNFSFKLDLCYALVSFDSKLKPAIAELNKIRNRLVHNHSAKFDKAGAVDLLNLVPESYKELKCFQNLTGPLSIWHACFYMCFIFLNEAFSRLISYKASQEIPDEEIDSLLEILRRELKNIKPKHKPNDRAIRKRIKSLVEEKYVNYNSGFIIPPTTVCGKTG